MSYLRCRNGTTVGRVPWFMEISNIRALASYLVERGELETVDEFIYFLHKPWKWTESYREMLSQ